MSQNTMDSKNEVCTFRIVCQVKTDEQALELKKKINEIFKDVEYKNISVSFTSNPLRPPIG